MKPNAWSNAAKAGQQLVAQDRQVREGADNARAVDVVSLGEIKPRPGLDTRVVNVGHVINIAESIVAVGLLEPLVIDRRNNLLAGGHRRAALQLAFEANLEERQDVLIRIAVDAGAKIKPDDARRVQDLDHKAALKHFPGAKIPVRRFDFDAEKDPERALAIETTENEARRDYSREEVIELAKRLQKAGLIKRRGRPRKGETALQPVVAGIICRSVRTVERMLTNEPKKKPEQLSESEMADLIITKAVKRGISLSSLMDAITRHTKH